MCNLLDRKQLCIGLNKVVCINNNNYNNTKKTTDCYNYLVLLFIPFYLLKGKQKVVCNLKKIFTFI